MLLQKQNILLVEILADTAAISYILWFFSTKILVSVTIPI